MGAMLLFIGGGLLFVGSMSSFVGGGLICGWGLVFVGGDCLVGSHLCGCCVALLVSWPLHLV